MSQKFMAYEETDWLGKGERLSEVVRDKAERKRI